jgi:hypothetical protein
MAGEVKVCGAAECGALVMHKEISPSSVFSQTQRSMYYRKNCVITAQHSFAKKSPLFWTIFTLDLQQTSNYNCEI